MVAVTQNRILNSIFAKYALSMITIIQLSSRVGIKHGAWACHSRDGVTRVLRRRMIPITVSSTACSA